MSNGPALIGETAIQATKEHWLNLEITKEMYCSYRGDCPLHRAIQGQELCLWCIHRAPIDIVEYLKRSIKDGSI